MLWTPNSPHCRTNCWRSAATGSGRLLDTKIITSWNALMIRQSPLRKGPGRQAIRQLAAERAARVPAGTPP